MAPAVHYLSLVGLSGLIRRGEIRSEEVVERLLERIGRLDGRLHSFALVMADAALVEARQADREIAVGRWRGPLHGVPVGIKDLIHTAGAATSAGTPVLKGFIPEHDATVVKRLRRAGAVILGKLRMSESAGLEHHPDEPRPTNPWSAAHWTGVSSSGSAVALAAGLCFGALGSDTGGSIRMPSAACAITGLKPTSGRVSRHGLVSLSHSFDCIGPMARSAADTAVILQAIAGADPNDPTAAPDPVPDYLAEAFQGLDGLRLGVDWRFATDDVAPEVAETVRRAVAVFEELGASQREVRFPATQTIAADLTPIMMCDMALAHAATFPSRERSYGARLANTLRAAAQISGVDVARANEARERFAGRVRQVLADVDFLLIPSMPTAPLRWDEVTAVLDDPDAVRHMLLRFAFPFNATGSPTLSVPSGYTDGGLPLGVQLVGAHMREPTLLRAACAYQRLTDFHTRRPPGCAAGVAVI